jgi:hypothetical protein
MPESVSFSDSGLRYRGYAFGHRWLPGVSFAGFQWISGVVVVRPDFYNR